MEKVKGCMGDRREVKHFRVSSADRLVRHFWAVHCRARLRAEASLLAESMPSVGRPDPATPGACRDFRSSVCRSTAGSPGHRRRSVVYPSAAAPAASGFERL
jgi:hypothetical protein